MAVEPGVLQCPAAHQLARQELITQQKSQVCMTGFSGGFCKLLICSFNRLSSEYKPVGRTPSCWGDDSAGLHELRRLWYWPDAKRA
jgi:hypothetical protein